MVFYIDSLPLRVYNPVFKKCPNSRKLISCLPRLEIE